MSQAHSRRLLSGVSFIALVSTINVASAAEVFPAGPNPAETIVANTDSIDVQPGAIVLTDIDGNSITIAGGVSVTDPTATAVTINNGILLGTFENNGIITGGDSGSEDAIYVLAGSQLQGGVVNTGTITGFSDGFDMESSSLAGGFVNNGVIQGGDFGNAAAIEIDENSLFAGGITNTNSLSGEYGINILDGAIVSGGIDNRAGAAITASGGAGISITDGFNPTTFDGGIRNAGDITGGEGGYGVFITNSTFEDGVTNVSTGTVTGDGQIAVYIGAADFSGGVFNEGNILATGAQALYVTGASFAGGIDNRNQIAATGATALYVNATNFTGGINNSGEIGSDLVGIRVDTAVPGGIVNSGNIFALTAIDISASSGGPLIQQTGGNIVGNVLFCSCGDSFFEGSGGFFSGVMVGTGFGDDLTVTGGTWAAEGGATLMEDVLTVGIGVFGGQFRGDLDGAGFDIDSATFATTLGRAYIDDNTTVGTGTQTYGAAGTLEYFLTDVAGTHGVVNSTNANLDGDLAAYFDWNSFAGNATQTFVYTGVITSTNPIASSFDNETALETNSIFFTASAAHVLANTEVDITGHRIGFDDFADLVISPTTNQAALGSALETIFVNGGANFLALEDPAGNGLQNPQTNNEGLYSALFQLPSAGAYAAALSSLDGHLHAQLAEATFNVNDLFDESIRSRLTSVHAALAEQYWSRAGLDGPKRYASAVVSANDASGAGRRGNPGVASGNGPWSMWAKAIFQGAEFEGDTNAEGFDQDIHGFGAGADYAFSPRTVAGVAVQFADSDIEFDQAFAPPGHADVESWQIAGYFSHGFGPVYLDAIGSATFNSYETNRVDFLGQPISADYDSTVYSIYGELGTIIGDMRSLRFQPFAGVGYRSADVDDFVETCPVACLAVTTDDPDSFYTDVGLALSKSYQWGSSTFVPELRGSWTHEFDDNRNVFTADLLGLPGVPFQVTGSEFDEDRFNLGANATLAVNQGLELYAGYRYTFADDLDAHTALAGFRATW